MAYEFLVPERIITGENALADAAAAFSKMGKHPLVVTDDMMVRLGAAEKLTSLLDEYTVYSGINGEPTDVMIEKGVEIYIANGCDCLIAIGGGSPIDSMKAIAACVNGGKITDFMGKIIEGSVPPMAAIPTTAGTGSEATQFTIITDTEKDVKMLLKGAALIPKLAVLDPQFTVTAPPAVTAATGLDALCHALEAYTSRKAQTMSDTFALSALKRIFKYLPAAFKNGGDIAARGELSTAALEAGIAFNNSSVTVIHGMSRPIGALFHVPHGISNAMLLLECMKFAVSGAPERFGAAAKAIGCADADDGDNEASLKLLEALEMLVAELEIPTLEEYGINRERFFASIDKMAHDAMVSGSPQNTIRAVTEEAIKDIYRRLWK